MLVAPGFHAERCVRYRYSYSACSRCADACLHEAIRLFDAGVEVLGGRCKHCGLCAAACQTEALNQIGVSADHLLKMAGESKQMTIACAPSELAATVVVPCLGALHPVVLAELSRQDIALELAGVEHCVECSHASRGKDMIRSNLAAREMLCSAGVPATWAAITLRSGEVEATGKHEKLDATRRSLFHRIVGHGADVVSGKLDAAPAPLKAIRAAAPFLPERKAILNKLHATGEGAITVFRHDAIPAEDWEVVRGCTYCEACVRVCPTGALQLLESNTAWRLAVLNDRCVACDVCAEVCQPKVLRREHAEEVIINKQKGRLMVAVAKQRCTQCDRVFVKESGGDVCPVCSGDDDDFASIFG
ncbi:MAG: 4Fe-4S binding protein [Nitrosomonadales bacterium]|nr:4Fe-4S binding protein [Nitrosomonadales bacterium]